MQNAIDAQGRSIEDLRREVEKLRASVDNGGRGTRASSSIPSASVSQTPPPPGPAQEVTKLEKRIRELEQTKSRSNEIGMTLSPEGMSTETPAAVGTTTTTLAGGSAAAPAPQQLAAVAPPPPPPPPSAPIDESWKREVAQEQAVVSAMAIPQRSEYLAALDSLAAGDCASASPRLATLSAGPNSPLSDNVLYWQARCAASRGDVKDAESKLDDLVTRYPRGDKAPAALWERGRLQIRSGDAADARTTLARLIKDYPSTSEAAQARLKITELEH
jgi:TolA-binding protein